MEILGYVEGLIYPSHGKERPTISLEIKDGSVRNLFHISKQAVVQFAAVTALVSSLGSLADLEPATARSIDGIQRMATRKGYSVDFIPSNSDKPTLIITPESKLLKAEESWVGGEFYFYGEVTTAGGKQDASIRLDTEEYGLLTISTDKDFLSKIEENLLYHECAVRATGRQDVNNGEIDKASLKLIDFVDYNPRFDESYINELVKQGASSWVDVNVDEYLDELRGRKAYV